MKYVSILGSTGTIGQNTLDVLSQHPNKFTTHVLTANANVEGMYQQCLTYRPKYAVMADEAAATQLSSQLKDANNKTEVISGQAGLQHAAIDPEVDIVVSGIVGVAGLYPTVEAVKAGKQVLLANKESLTAAGELIFKLAAQSQAQIIPLDSEHNAILQCLPQDYVIGTRPESLAKITLTASGGPFLKTPLNELAAMTPAQACAHPNWVMGQKISVDSATLMNKGLEVIEACWLFNVPMSDIEVFIHPTSQVHGLAHFTDGSVLAQMGSPDMRIPISYGLGYPKRITSGAAGFDLTHQTFEFLPVDKQRYPCFQLAYDAMQTGGTAPGILTIANEIAVEQFLRGEIKFTDIYPTIDAMMQRSDIEPLTSEWQIIELYKALKTEMVVN